MLTCHANPRHSYYIPITFLFASLLISSFHPTRASSISVCDVGCWSETGSPVYAQLGAFSSLKIPYASGLNTTTTGIVIMYVADYLFGQTLEISTATLQLAAGANGTAYPITIGLASGTYIATFFVVSTSGIQMSGTGSVSFTV